MKKYAICAILASFFFTATATAQDNKQFYNEKAFKFNLIMSGLDLALGKIGIDGKRIREGNPLVATRDGRLSTGKGILAFAVSNGLPLIVYKFDKDAGRKMMWVSGGVHSAGVVMHVVVRF